MKKIILSICLLYLANIIYGQNPTSNKAEIDVQANQLKELQKKIDELEKNNETPDNGFKVSLGGSFDFNRGISATDLYYDLTYYNLNLWPTTSPKTNRKKGLDFKLYQSLLFSNPIDTNRISSFTSVYLGEGPIDSIFVGDFSFNRIEELDFTDFGLLIRPTYQLSKTIYFFGHAEFLFRETTQKISYSSIDTIAVRQVSNDFITKPFLPSNRTNRYYDALYFLGLGFNFNLALADSTTFFRIKPTLGLSSIASASRLNYSIGNESVEGKLKAFYLLDIEILEKNSGIKLGINIRDNNIASNESILDKPRFSIFLSKQFSLNKLADFLKSK